MKAIKLNVRFVLFIMLYVQGCSNFWLFRWNPTAYKCELFEHFLLFSVVFPAATTTKNCYAALKAGLKSATLLLWGSWIDAPWRQRIYCILQLFYSFFMSSFLYRRCSKRELWYPNDVSWQFATESIWLWKKMQLLKNNNFTVILITCSERGAKYRISLLTLNVLSNNLEL